VNTSTNRREESPKKTCGIFSYTEKTERFEKLPPPFIMSFCAKFSKDMRSSFLYFNEKPAQPSHIHWPNSLMEAHFHGAQPGIRRPGAPIHLNGGQFWNF
jgi:hypothetical protein